MLMQHGISDPAAVEAALLTAERVPEEMRRKGVRGSGHPRRTIVGDSLTLSSRVPPEPPLGHGTIVHCRSAPTVTGPV